MTYQNVPPHTHESNNWKIIREKADWKHKSYKNQSGLRISFLDDFLRGGILDKNRVKNDPATKAKFYTVGPELTGHPE